MVGCQGDVGCCFVFGIRLDPAHAVVAIEPLDCLQCVEIPVQHLRVSVPAVRTIVQIFPAGSKAIQSVSL